MRKTTLVLNSFVVAFFSCFLAYTFVGRQHLDSLARAFVTEKTVVYSKPVVELARDALDSPAVRKLLADNQVLSDNQMAAIRREIAEYQIDPGAYVADLTRQRVREVPMKNKNAMLEKVVSFKNKIRTYYDNTLNALVADLRIFSSSNLIAGLIAFAMAYRSSSKIRKPIVWFSFLMCVAVLFCSYMYIDGLTFFRIMFQVHMGWRYAVFLCVMIAVLYFDYGRHAKAAEQRHSHGAADTAVSSGQSSSAAR